MTQKQRNSCRVDARFGAYEILQRVEEGGYSDLLLNSWLSKQHDFDPRERGLLTELVYGVLRLRGRLDYALAPFSKQKLNRLEPGALRLLRLGAYQLLELDRIPAHAAVHATVDLARQVGLDRVSGLINGVLRTLDRERTTIAWPTVKTPRPYLQHVCSLPVWLAKELMRQLSNTEAIAFGQALATAAPYCLRVNSLKTDRDHFLALLEHERHVARPSRYAPEGVIFEQRGDGRLPGDAEGLYQVQDEASMLIAHLLDAREGETLLDGCAAPGGKTTHLAALTDNKSRIIALDKHSHRVDLIRNGAKRLGCTTIEARKWDLTESPDFIEGESLDRILLDAPCSGLGVLRRNPESRWNRTSADIADLAELQKSLLDRVAPLLKSGGRLLYSVCTFTSRETDDVVAGFLARHPEFVLEDLRETVPVQWQELLTEEGTLRSYPHRHDGMDAFFAARFRKIK
jgi:16S rRNA (cytosine967-C5)-methyltransferase